MQILRPWLDPAEDGPRPGLWRRITGKRRASRPAAARGPIAFVTRNRRALALIAASAAVALIGRWLSTAGGPPPLRVQFAHGPDHFAALFRRDGQLDLARIARAREALDRDTFFILSYVTAALLWIRTTGRARRLGQRLPTALASMATLGAGALDLLENNATRRALDALTAGEAPVVSTVSKLAAAKWITIACVGTYLWLRGLETPRRLNVRIVAGQRFATLAPDRAASKPATRPATTRRRARPRAAARQPIAPPSVEQQAVATGGLRAEFARSLDKRDSKVLHGVMVRADSVRPARWLRAAWHWLFGEPPVLPEAAAELDLDASLARPPAPAIGVACSGGGVRSACFSLGALQALRERDVLERAAYVTAVSGGGYLAAGWAIAASRRPDVADDVFAPGSPEESWLRRHSALIPDIPTALGGVARILAGIVVNALIIWLVLFVIARPAGWLIHETHAELRSRQPFMAIERQPEVKPARAEPKGVPRVKFERTDAATCGCDDPAQAWLASPLLTTSKVAYWSDGASRQRHAENPVEVTPGLVVVVDGKLTVARQPHAAVPLSRADLAPLAPRGSSADTDVPALTISRQVRMTVVDDSVPAAEPFESQLRVTAPRLEQHSGTTGRKAFQVGGWLWGATAAAVVLFLLVQLAQMVWRPVEPAGLVAFQWLTWLSGVAAAGTVILLVVLPWLVYAVPPFVAGLVSALPGPNTSSGESSQATITVAAGGTGLVAIATVGRLLRGPVFSVARKWPLAMAKVVVFVVLVTVPFVVFIGQVQLGAANGPGGHLVAAGTIGIGLVKSLRETPDVVRWISAGGVLLAWRYLFDAHANSLFPFYKQRMSEAFAVARQPDDTKAQPVPYKEEVAWTNYGSYHLRADEGPELVLCATVNAYGPGEAPSGRRASSFTFSPRKIGGPDVGYVDTAAYLGALGKGRRKDVTVPATIAIAGAAFSPGMGKMSKGPIDNLLALANARLGVWLPHPIYVKDRIEHGPSTPWRDRPGWPQFLREVVGRFRLTTPYVYVSDGGHWENLGMVELLRRGCRNVFVISAAGDGAASFATIGEAIALAREELGIEIDVDLEPMRAAWAAADTPLENALRRGKAATPAALAAQAFAVGKIFEPNAAGEVVQTGVIVILEANLSAKQPWDVTTWAEGHEIFPDDSTLNQNFNHRQLESYRVLGRLQVTAALRQADVLAAFSPKLPAPPYHLPA